MSSQNTVFHLPSNQGSEFMFHFFHSLGKVLDMTLYFTSGYYLGGDGQTKCTNQMLEQYIQAYSNYQQDNWLELLPLVEFTFNNPLSATTGISPFFMNKRYHLNFLVHFKWDLTEGLWVNRLGFHSRNS